MKTRVSSKGQLVLPAELRRRDRIEPGQEFEIEAVGRGEYKLRRVGRRRNHGLVDHLRACPAKGWFRPIDRTETTDRIQPPTFE
jgi:AbrB family looped-hinge helix DNA binding protein